MPRGGGGFGGGGFRGGFGGGFGGGGFGGGGRRGGSPGFRSGPSGGSPFGRTGAQRNVSRGPGGRNYYGRHGGYYGGRYGRGWGWGWGWGGGWGYRPWYGRGYWWWGNPFSPWYYSPVYIGGGLILLIVMSLLVIPVVGLMAVPYPASNSQDITYSSTQTINYNEYFYESEYLAEGNTINYAVQANGPISFAIWNQPFSNFPQSSTRHSGSMSDSFTVATGDNYQYESFYLYTGDSVSYHYSIQNYGLQFFIADGPNLQNWNNYQSATLYNQSNQNPGSYSGSFTAPHNQDWYLVWYNQGSGGSTASVSVSINYAISSLDISQASVHVYNTTNVPEATFTAPTAGTYYFFIYFDPSLSPSQSVDTSFNIVYHQNVSSNERWQQQSLILEVLAVIIIILLAVAIIQRINAKKYEKNKKAKAANGQTSGQPTSQQSVPTVSQPVNVSGNTIDVYSAPNAQSSTGSSSGSTKNRCHVCGNAYFETDVYCPNCGTKLMGRDYGVPTQTTPLGSQNCAVCGTYLPPQAKFCPDCGTQVIQNY